LIHPQAGVAYVRPPPCTFRSFVISACTWADRLRPRAELGEQRAHHTLLLLEQCQQQM
jgi:hypothetical protein